MPATIEPDVRAAVDAARTRWPGLAADVSGLVHSLTGAGVDTARLRERGDDLVLAHAAAAGDPAAIAALETSALVTARRIASRYLRDDVRSDEVVQQLRIHLLLADGAAQPRLARYDGRSPLAGWVGMCAARLALHALRDERRTTDIALEWSEALAELPATDASVECIRAQHATAVAAALRDACLVLPRRHRALVRLLFVDGASIEHAAAMYQVHRVTVWRWVQEARALLAAEMRVRLGATIVDTDRATASLVAWVVDQVELSLDGVLAPTATASIVS